MEAQPLQFRLRSHARCATRVSTFPFVLLAVTLVLFPAFALGDVIYLKNGRKIEARVIREDERQVYYETEGGEIVLPRSIIDRIEKSAIPEAASTAPPFPAKQRELPLPPSLPVDLPPGSSSPVIKDNALDQAYLRGVEDNWGRDPSPENTLRMKQAYQQAAVFLMRQGDAEAAINMYQEALKALPDDLALTLGLGYLLVSQSHYMEAVSTLLPASAHHAQSPDVLLLLGSAYYGLEDLNQAIAEWNKALALRDNPRLRDAVAKAERERQASSSYRELRSDHFLLRYEGQKEKLSDEVLASLEGSFQNLALDLNYAPTETIVVLLYPNETFRDITRSPSWVGALNDGKIRVPVSGITQMSADLARVLKHELTHSFVRQITLGRCPTWFNEGLAQLEEGATTASQGTSLARAMAAGNLPLYSALEGPFVNLPSDQVNLVYAKSLAGLEYIRDAAGMGEICNLLKAMPSHPDINSLLQEELRLGYPEFEQEVANYVAKRYGS